MNRDLNTDWMILAHLSSIHPIRTVWRNNFSSLKTIAFTLDNSMLSLAINTTLTIGYDVVLKRKYKDEQLSSLLLDRLKLIFHHQPTIHPILTTGNSRSSFMTSTKVKGLIIFSAAGSLLADITPVCEFESGIPCYSDKKYKIFLPGEGKMNWVY